jgi:acyl-CoA thioesterase-1
VNSRIKLAILCLLVAVTTGCTQRPRILIIGDSISMGYTPFVKQMLRGKAKVHRPKGNHQSTAFAMNNLDRWIAGKDWNVIHFNWGLHDVKYIDEMGLRIEPALGKIQVPIDQYEINLEQLVIRLKDTKAQLIFATTTPVPPGAHGRITGEAARYNAIAIKIMNQHAVAVDDLYTAALQKLDQIQRPANVHFTEAGSEFLATNVAAKIQQALILQSLK